MASGQHGPAAPANVQQVLTKKTVFRIRIQLNPDPAKNLIPDPDPEALNPDLDPRYFLTPFEKKVITS